MVQPQAIPICKERGFLVLQVIKLHREMRYLLLLPQGTMCLLRSCLSLDHQWAIALVLVEEDRFHHHLPLELQGTEFLRQHLSQDVPMLPLHLHLGMQFLRRHGLTLSILRNMENNNLVPLFPRLLLNNHSVAYHLPQHQALVNQVHLHLHRFRQCTLKVVLVVVPLLLLQCLHRSVPTDLPHRHLLLHRCQRAVDLHPLRFHHKTALLMLHKLHCLL